MRICLTTRYFNRYEGTPKYVVELAERFTEEHEVHLLTSSYDYEIPNLIVHKMPLIKRPGLLQILSDCYFSTKYTKRMKRELGDVVIHSAGSDSLSSDVVTVHVCWDTWLKDYKTKVGKLRSYMDYKTRIARAIQKKMVKNARKVIAVSEKVKRDIMKYYGTPGEKITVIPNGVNLEEFKHDPYRRTEIRERYGISDSDVVLLFVGHDFERKGLEYAIKALPEVSNNVKLLVVGKGNPEAFQKLARKLGVIDKTIFTGFVPEIKHYYDTSDIFVFPTYTEGFSLTMLEAVASGLPVLATNVSGSDELIIDGYNGFFIERDPKNIAEKINILVNDENLRKQMCKNARRSAERYSWDATAERTLEVYEEVLKR